MQTMLVSEFKAKAIATLKRVRQTGEPVMVTLRGEPLAEVVAVRTEARGGVVLGSGRGLMKHRLTEKQLVEGDAASEWDMNP